MKLRLRLLQVCLKVLSHVELFNINKWYRVSNNRSISFSHEKHEDSRVLNCKCNFAFQQATLLSINDKTRGSDIHVPGVVIVTLTMKRRSLALLTVFPALSSPKIRTKYSSFWKRYFHNPDRRVYIWKRTCRVRIRAF